MADQAAKTIDVLVVDDSLVVREFLREILSSDPDLRVVGAARDGEQAVAMTAKLRPRVITMDISMPRMDGFSATRAIMESTPTPIVVVSENWSPEEVSKTFDALDAGALAILRKPRATAPDFQAQAAQIISTVKLMSEVRVVRRFRRREQAAPTPRPPELPTPPPRPAQSQATPIRADLDLVAVGASTGGPQALRALLAPLPTDFPLPIAIVQHITEGFLQGLVDWLATTTALTVKIAEQGERMRPGCVYFAPTSQHMRVAPGCVARLSDDPPVSSLRPAVSVLFESVARACGPRSAALLLTGMGCDGAREMRTLRDLGALTMAQDKESSIVHGMPGEAIRLGGAECVMTPDEMARRLLRAVATAPHHVEPGTIVR